MHEQLFKNIIYVYIYVYNKKQAGFIHIQGNMENMGKNLIVKFQRKESSKYPQNLGK